MDDVDDIFEANLYAEDCFGGKSPGSVPIHPHDEAIHPYNELSLPNRNSMNISQVDGLDGCAGARQKK
jgi:hypothetical protein